MNTKNKMLEILIEKYGLIISDKQLSEILNVSIATLYRMRERGDSPKYKKKNSKSKNGTIVYNILDVIDYLYKEEN